MISFDKVSRLLLVIKNAWFFTLINILKLPYLQHKASFLNSDVHLKKIILSLLQFSKFFLVRLDTYLYNGMHYATSGKVSCCVLFWSLVIYIYKTVPSSPEVFGESYFLFTDLCVL